MTSAPGGGHLDPPVGAWGQLDPAGVDGDDTRICAAGGCTYLAKLAAIENAAPPVGRGRRGATGL